MLNKEKAEIAILNKISHILVHERDISEFLKQVLEILRKELKLISGSVVLLRGNCLFTEASVGTGRFASGRDKYQLGQDFPGTAAQNGKVVLVPDVSETEPDSAGIPVNRALICVPVKHAEQIIGVLCTELENEPERLIEKDSSILQIVSGILADAIAVSLLEHDEHRVLIEENMRLREELGNTPKPANLIGNSDAMRTVYRMISQVAPSTATVLIRGASGTGKELVARAIHEASPRSGKSFIAVNCAALPDSLIESELFGFEKGAFTGAVTQRIGRVEAADGGTLFLDEIGDLSINVQVKLLRFLQERTFSRVGSNEERQVNVRVLAATSRDLEKLLEEGSFREDLYYRLNVFPIHLPSLHKRGSDIIMLADHFLEKYNRLHGKNIARISTPAINMLMAYHWPGNVRELENCIERTVLTASDTVIHGYNLPPSLQTGEASGSAVIRRDVKADFKTMVSSFERELIVDSLKANNGNVAAAARQLGLSERIIHYKIGKLGITSDWYKLKKNR